MKHFITIFCSLFVLASCSDWKNIEYESGYNKNEYVLLETDSYNFRRAYHGHDTLKGEELNLFMNRNPAPNDDYSNSKANPLYKNLTEIGIFQDGNLNIKGLDTLPDQFIYQVSQNKFLKVNLRYLEDTKSVATPSMELTFTDNHNIVLIDTLEFYWPPDITFIKMDIDKDNTDELLTIYKWYQVNGDNYELKIYELKKVANKKIYR